MALDHTLLKRTVAALRRALRPALRRFALGMSMGCVDLLPGISGSSVAYLLGSYEALVQAVSAPWEKRSFLIPLVLGIATSVLALCVPIHVALSHAVLGPSILCFFIGISAACAVGAFIEGREHLSYICIGGISSAALTLFVSTEYGMGVETSRTLLLFASFVAGVTMILPAVSGAQILLLFGVFEEVVSYLAHFVRTGNFETFTVLLQIFLSAGSGILLGAIFMRRMLKLMRGRVHAFFAGFITLALPRLWPFHSGARSNKVYWIGVCLVAVGIALGIYLLQLAGRRRQQESL